MIKTSLISLLLLVYGASYSQTTTIANPINVTPSLTLNKTRKASLSTRINLKVNKTTSLNIYSTSCDLCANRGWGVGTVTSVRNIDYIKQTSFPGGSLPAEYIAVGSPSYTVSNNKVNFTGIGGAGEITKFIRSDSGVLEECNTVEVTATLNQIPDATSYGIGVGLQSYNPYCPTETVAGGIVLANGNKNYGKVFIYGDYNTTAIYSSDSNININNGDEFNISLSQRGLTYTIIVKNQTQSWVMRNEIEITSTFTPIVANNSAYPAFYHLGGSVSVDMFKYTIHAPANTDIMFVGNSITLGQEATDQHHRFINLVGVAEDNIYSGGGCDISQSIVTRLPEIVAIKPYRVFLYDIAGNDIAQGISSAIWQANLRTIRNTLVSAGIKVVWGNGQPRTLTNETPQKNFIESEPRFQGDLIVDTWTSVLGSGTSLKPVYSSDGIHLNNAGMLVQANVINAALGFPNVITK